MAAGELAVKAFAYGTLLCAGGAAATALLIAAALDVRDLQGFSDRMRELGPRVRARMEAGLSPALGAVADGGAAVARGAGATAGRAVQAIAPPVAHSGWARAAGGSDRGDELAGLTSKERAAVKEWMGGWTEESAAVETVTEAAAATRGSLQPPP